MFSVFIDNRPKGLHPPLKICERRTQMDTYILDDYNDQFAKFGKLVAAWLLLKIIF